ncbi:MAG: hypothetical protein OFPI_00430 [Osedax symbiont Rs2]|nr:MAG: hypothetical protein OFPI_00430 [Osedax symbiont Rs2]
MIIRINLLKKIYLFISIFYYTGFLNFFTKLATGPTNTEGSINMHASGSMTRQILGVVLLISGIYILLKVDKIIVWKSVRNNYNWVLLIGYFLISMQWSYEPDITFRRTIAFSTLLVSAFCIVHIIEMKSLLALIGKAIFCAAIFGLVYAIIDPSNGLINSGNRTNVLIGIYGDKNAGARVYAYGLLILVGLGRTSTYMDKFMLLTLTFCLIIAESATAIVMVLGGLSLMLLFNFFHTNINKKNLVRMFIIIIIIVLTSISVGYLYDYILQLLGRDQTLTNRTIIWEMMDIYIQNEPMLGYGFGAFWSSDAVISFVDRWGYIANAHSGYYEVLLHGGKVGFILLFLLIFSTLRSLTMNYISHQHGKIFCIFISIYLIQLIVNYVAFILLNHNSFDMFLLAVISFISSRELAVNSKGSNSLKNSINLINNKNTFS